MIKQHFTQDSESDEKIVLDKDAFKALASDTRVDILKSLDLRRKTLSEISLDLGLSVATIKEHLSHLSESGLVKQKDEGRKWKYYNLTEKAKAVLYPERKKIWVLLISFLFIVSFASIFTFNDLGMIDFGTSKMAMSTKSTQRNLPLVDEKLESAALRYEQKATVMDMDSNDYSDDGNNRETIAMMGNSQKNDSLQNQYNPDRSDEKFNLSWITLIAYIFVISTLLFLILEIIKYNKRRISKR